jgi:rod shape-determining protein MreB
MTTAVYQHLRRDHQIVVGELTAEDTKMGANGVLRVEGRDAASGRPKVASITSEEVAEALRSTSDAIIRTLADCLEDLPPQVLGDVMKNGLLAFGGGSLLSGFAQLLEEAFGLQVRIADRPLTCVAEGAAACLGRSELLAAYARL